jgi:hypothetical protein
MPKEPKWEEVSNSGRAVGGFVTIVNRMSVPGGWLYIHSLMRIRTWGRDDIYITSAFVPDRESPG